MLVRRILGGIWLGAIFNMWMLYQISRPSINDAFSNELNHILATIFILQLMLFILVLSILIVYPSKKEIEEWKK